MIRDWSGRKDRVQEKFDWEVGNIKSQLENSKEMKEEDLKKLFEQVQKLRVVQEVFKQQAQKLLLDEEVSQENKKRLPGLIKLYEERLDITRELSLTILHKTAEAMLRKNQDGVMRAGQSELPF